MAKLGGIYVSVRGRTEKYKRDLAEAKTLTKKAVVVMQHHISSISWQQVTLAAAAFFAVVAKGALDGFRAMEKMKLSAASLASTITSFAKGAEKDLSGTYLQALGYSQQLVLKMEELNAQTVATGENLTAMVETMAQGGVLLDINNKKQVDGFLAIANALALITQGQNQDIQFRQEIRGLINGEVRSTNMLARLLQQRIGGSLKDHVKLWKEQGTLIESAGALLTGFQEGAKDLSNTWLAVGTTLETMYNRTLRGLMAPVYEDIVRLGKEITLNALDQNSALNENAALLRNVVYKGWQDIKNVVEVTGDLIAAFKDPLLVIGKLLSLIIDGWGQIFAILPAITERMKLLTQAVLESLKMIGNWGKALALTMAFQFEEAAKAWESAKENWIESGKKTGEVFSEGFLNEIEARINNFNKDLTPPALAKVSPPELSVASGGAGTDDTDDKAMEKFMRRMGARIDIIREFNLKHEELGLDRFEIERLQLEREVEAYRKAGADKNKIDEFVSKKSTEIAHKEQMAKLDLYKNAAGGIADTFQMIAQAGGKQSKEAFIAYKAFAMAQAAIAGRQAILSAMKDYSPPVSFVMAGIAGAAAAVQIGMIASSQPPSYDSGGVSNARGVYQTGNIREAHVPIPSGKIPVEINGGQEQKAPEVNIFNTVDPTVMDQYMSSSRGQNAIFNAIGSQPQRLRSVMR